MKTSTANIIIVDEDEQEGLSLKQTLGEENYSVSVVGNAVMALEKIRKEFFDILLVDYKLPDMNGIELIKQAAAVSKESVSLIITGFSSLEIAIESMRIGAHDYIVKPINVDELKKNIEAILAERESLKKGMGMLQEVVKRLEMSEEDIAVTAGDFSDDEKGLVSGRGIFGPVIRAFKNLKTFFWDID